MTLNLKNLPSWTRNASMLFSVWPDWTTWWHRRKRTHCNLKGGIIKKEKMMYMANRLSQNFPREFVDSCSWNNLAYFIFLPNSFCGASWAEEVREQTKTKSKNIFLKLIPIKFLMLWLLWSWRYITMFESKTEFTWRDKSLPCLNCHCPNVCV